VVVGVGVGVVVVASVVVMHTEFGDCLHAGCGCKKLKTRF
jgi:hypothetical protein